MPSVVLTFLLSAPPHQRQLAYNSTTAGRSQHILRGFTKVGHLPLFAAIVRIVPIICAILVFRACVGNLLYLKRNWRLLSQTPVRQSFLGGRLLAAKVRLLTGVFTT